jgi:hypothetical protein
MSNTSDHMEAPDVLRLAGCDTPTYDEHAKAQTAALKRGESLRLEKEIADWREGREDELERYVFTPCSCPSSCLQDTQEKGRKEGRGVHHFALRTRA